jgi:hypothetical protein
MHRIISCLLLIGICCHTNASPLAPMSFEAMVSESTHIFLATIKEGKEVSDQNMAEFPFPVYGMKIEKWIVGEESSLGAENYPSIFNLKVGATYLVFINETRRAPLMRFALALEKVFSGSIDMNEGQFWYKFTELDNNLSIELPRSLRPTVVSEEVDGATEKLISYYFLFELLEMEDYIRGIKK